MLNGDLRTVYQYGGSLADLRKTCERFLEQANYTGYHGDVMTFLEPHINPGDVVKIRSYREPERNGRYLVRSGKLTVGVKGGRQRLELERILNDTDTVTTQQI